MQRVVTDCYADADKAVLRAGLLRLSHLRFGNPPRSFSDMSTAHRERLLVTLSREAARHASSSTNADAPLHYFNLIRQLTLWGFFTSEAGASTLRHVPVPGRYDGHYPYKVGDAAFTEKMSQSLVLRDQLKYL